ncbi:MAG TPA: hypothetical protein VNN79_16035 [Actinomycetota bacterium]|nr:hypothetical protein [Actinomycetota bacterium]
MGWNGRRVLGAVVVGAAIVASTAGPVGATPGDLDPTFSGDGMAVTKFNQGAYAETVALQSDRKIVVGGYTSPVGGNEAWALVRFLPDGTLDQTFGKQGRVVTNWTGADDELWGLVVLGNDKIVAAGSASGQMAVARYTRSGFLDTTFGGGDGEVTIDFTPSHDRAWDIQTAPGGKLVVAGQAGPASQSMVALARLKPGGALDHSFSGDGMATEDVNGLSSLAWDVLVQADGSIVAAGAANGATDKTMVTKFTEAGEVDTSFGENGSWVATSPGNAYANAIVQLASGKYMVAAAVGSFPYDVGLFRFLATGREDDTFGASGLVAHDFGGSETPTDLRLVGTRLVVSLTETPVASSSFSAAVARMQPSGAPDTAFGDQGLAVSGLTRSRGDALAIQANGRILVVGPAYGSGQTGRFGATRFLRT